jgi:hypothetical protein
VCHCLLVSSVKLRGVVRSVTHCTTSQPSRQISFDASPRENLFPVVRTSRTTRSDKGFLQRPTLDGCEFASKHSGYKSKPPPHLPPHSSPDFPQHTSKAAQNIAHAKPLATPPTENYFPPVSNSCLEIKAKTR